MTNSESTFADTATVLKRGEEGYEAARRDAVWNSRKPERYPSLIVVAESEDDVVAAVRYASVEGLTVGIRSGGHSWVGNGIRDDGVLIDLSKLTSVTVDAASRIATVGPSAKGPAINALLGEHQLFFPTGHAPTVGVGGFILGGGYGWNSRALGPACLSIVGIDVVLANGELVHADDTTHPDLLWAARGSGPGFFGIVTKFYLTVYPLASQILRTVHTYPISLRDEVLAWSYTSLESLSSAVEISAKVGYLAETDQQVVFLTATAFCTRKTGSDLLAALEQVPFREEAIRAIVNEPTSIEELYAIADRLNPPGRRWALDGVWLDAPVDEILDRAAPMFNAIPPGLSFVLWMLWGHYPEQANACWSAQARVYLSPNAGWNDASDDLDYETWTHNSLEPFAKMSRGLQFSDNNLADRYDDGLSSANARRLEEIRDKYDPARLFHTYMRPAESTTAYGRHLRNRG